MNRFYVHTLLNTLHAFGLLAIGAVIAVRFGIDVYAGGFALLGVYSLGRTLGPVALPSRFTRHRISRKRLVVDVAGLVLIGLVLGLLVFERTTISSYISV